jgi:hypothetical protein
MAGFLLVLGSEARPGPLGGGRVSGWGLLAVLGAVWVLSGVLLAWGVRWLQARAERARRRVER